MSNDDTFSRPELPAGWATDAYWRAAVHILAAFGDDGRVWDHVSPSGIVYPAILEEGWSSGERRVLQAAASLWDDSPVSLLDVLSGVSDRYWQLIVEAAQILRDGLR